METAPGRYAELLSRRLLPEDPGITQDNCNSIVTLLAYKKQAVSFSCAPVFCNIPFSYRALLGKF